MSRLNDRKSTDSFEYVIVVILILTIIVILSGYAFKRDMIIMSENTSEEVTESGETAIDKTNQFELIHMSAVRGNQIKIFRNVYTDVLYLKIDQSIEVMYDDDGSVLTYNKYKENLNKL